MTQDGRRAAARVERATWLSDDVLLVVVGFPAGRVPQPNAARLSVDGGVPLEVATVPFPPSSLLLTGRLLRGRSVHEPLGTLVLEAGKAEIALAPAELSEALADVRAVARELGGLDSETRDALLRFLGSSVVNHAATTNASRLHKSLFSLREALRERLPASVMARSEPQAVAIESVLALDESAFYLKGWLHDEHNTTARLTAVSPEGTRVELFDRLFRYRRADIEYFYGRGADLRSKHGFIAYFELGTRSSLATGWVVEMVNVAGDGVETRGPDVVRDPTSVRDTILGDLGHEPPSSERLIVEHAHPALTRMQARLRDSVEVESVLTYGAPSEAAEISIVVPLYRRIDLLEHQLALFADDPEVHSADLIYVLDSPELAEALAEFAQELHLIYRVPFRIATLARNAGYSAANNIGADLAWGRLLVLLNSDVLPTGAGWLGALGAFYDATPEIGALGPKLVYEDGSLQHAGLSFVRRPGSPIWENVHYFKGLHRTLPAANVTRPVPAVTGACLMIDKDVYERSGGLRGFYVQGDNEDSDLCLRLLEAGYHNWYFRDVELYHLEAQSYPSEQRALTRRYNDWLQTRIWGERIEAVMSEFAAGDRAVVPAGAEPS